MSADGEAARKALQEALREEARPNVPLEQFELAVDRVLARLWIAGFVVTAIDAASAAPARRRRQRAFEREPAPSSAPRSP